MSYISFMSLLFDFAQSCDCLIYSLILWIIWLFVGGEHTCAETADSTKKVWLWERHEGHALAEWPVLTQVEERDSREQSQCDDKQAMVQFDSKIKIQTKNQWIKQTINVARFEKSSVFCNLLFEKTVNNVESYRISQQFMSCMQQNFMIVARFWFCASLLLLIYSLIVWLFD